MYMFWIRRTAQVPGKHGSCLLPFTIYVGSAIYTTGIPSITSEFHVSTVAATVGLTLSVAGYGLG
jgi:MFS transporter, DHA1 family, multidrug resistance protein